MRHEGRRALRFLRDVVEGVTVYGSDGRRRSQDNQHLFLRGAYWNLFQGTFRQNIAPLERLGRTAAGRKRERAGERQSEAGGRLAMMHGLKSQTRQLHFGLASGGAVT